MNKKGCVIAAVIVVVLAALGIGGCLFLGMKYGSEMGNAGVAFAVETAIGAYRSQHPDEEVPLSNEVWAEKLKGFEVPGSGAQSMSQFIQDGKLVDIFKREMKLEQDADGKIRAISAGKDGLMNTEDDVTSKLFRRFQEKVASPVPDRETPKIVPSSIE